MAGRKGLLGLAACIAFVFLSWTHLSLLAQVGCRWLHFAQRFFVDRVANVVLNALGR
jgi:hypothetical protein